MRKEIILGNLDYVATYTYNHKHYDKVIPTFSLCEKTPEAKGIRDKYYVIEDECVTIKFKTKECLENVISELTDLLEKNNWDWVDKNSIKVGDYVVHKDSFLDETTTVYYGQVVDATEDSLKVNTNRHNLNDGVWVTRSNYIRIGE